MKIQIIGWNDRRSKNSDCKNTSDKPQKNSLIVQNNKLLFVIE